MRIATIVLIAGILISWGVETSVADTMRCGNDFVKINDSAFVVVKKVW